MGALCSTGTDKHPGDEALSPESEHSASCHIFSMAPSSISEKITRQKSKAMLKDFTFASEADYASYRLKLLADETEESFDGQAQKNATALERRASKIVFKIKERDALRYFGGVREEFSGRVHFPESHFLTTVDTINKTDLIQCAQRLPKGAHLHCHFNSCLPPIFLLREAKGNPHMFIKSDICLHPEIRQNFPLAEIQFQMHLIEDQKDLKESLSPQNKAYKTSYTPEDKKTGWYSYDRFLEEFEILNEDGEREYGEEAAERWLASKLVFTESQTYDVEITGKGSVTWKPISIR
jgi:adenosine deaminase CECR1